LEHTTVRFSSAARLDPGTIVRVESAGPKPVGGSAITMQAVLETLHRHGVAFTARGVELVETGRK